jgi:hypothetical protein
MSRENSIPSCNIMKMSTLQFTRIMISDSFVLALFLKAQQQTQRDKPLEPQTQGHWPRADLHIALKIGFVKLWNIGLTSLMIPIYAAVASNSSYRFSYGHSFPLFSSSVVNCFV